MKELRDFIGGIKRKRSFTSADISRFISEAGSVSEEYCTEYPDDPVECLVIAADTAAYVSKMSDFSVREDYRTNKSEYTALSPDGKVKYHYLHGKLISADFTENTEKLRIPDK